MNAFNTNFKHRVEANSDGEFYNVVDTLAGPLERIAALADLMEMAYEDCESSEHHTLWRFAQTIRLEALDAKALLNAYYDAQNAAKGINQQA